MMFWCVQFYYDLQIFALYIQKQTRAKCRCSG